MLVSPGKCPKKGRRTYPQLRLLPGRADWRVSQALSGGDRGLGVHLAMRRLFCTFKYLHFQVGKRVFEEKHLEVAGGRASYLEYCKGETCKDRVLQKQTTHFYLTLSYVTLDQLFRN